MLIVALFSGGDDWSSLKIKASLWWRFTSVYVYVCSCVHTCMCKWAQCVSWEVSERDQNLALKSYISILSFHDPPFRQVPTLSYCTAVTLLGSSAQGLCVTISKENGCLLRKQKNLKFSDAPDQELTCNTASGSATRFQIKFKWLHFTWLSEHVLSDIYKLHLRVSGIKTVENNSHMENSMLNQSFVLCLLHVSTQQHS